MAAHPLYAGSAGLGQAMRGTGRMQPDGMGSAGDCAGDQAGQVGAVEMLDAQGEEASKRD